MFSSPTTICLQSIGICKSPYKERAGALGEPYRLRIEVWQSFVVKNKIIVEDVDVLIVSAYCLTSISIYLAVTLAVCMVMTMYRHSPPGCLCKGGPLHGGTAKGGHPGALSSCSSSYGN